MKIFKSLSDVVTVLIIILLIPIVLINVSVLYKAYKYPDKIPDIFGYKPFIVISDTMDGVIDSGDLVIFKIAEPDSLKKGDVIAFRVGDTVVTHRINEVNKNEDNKCYFNTKGDNKKYNDSFKVNEDALEGVFVKRYSKLGRALLFFTDPIGFVVIILLFVFLVLVDSLVDYIKSLKKQLVEEE